MGQSGSKISREFKCTYVDDGRRKWQPTPVFLTGKSMDRGAWWPAVQRAAKSHTQWSDKAYMKNDDINLCFFFNFIFSQHIFNKLSKVDVLCYSQYFKHWEYSSKQNWQILAFMKLALQWEKRWKQVIILYVMMERSTIRKNKPR